MIRLKTIANRFFKNRKIIKQDAFLATKHLSSFPFLFSPINSESSVKSELDYKSYDNLSDVLTVISQVLIPAERKSISAGTLVCHPDKAINENVNGKWFFINGIATSPPLALLNARELAKTFCRPIHLIHTPTFGVVWDLWNAMTARTLRKDGKLSRPAFNIIKDALLKNERVVLIAHSQGTIVSSYIVRKLLKNKETKELVHKLEIYCVAGVADSFKVDEALSEKYGHSVPYVEHFVNGEDYFCRIGILAHLERTSGKVFNLDKKHGHLLNDHYIPGIVRGDYCLAESRLHKYVLGNVPDDDDYIKRCINP